MGISTLAHGRLGCSSISLTGAPLVTRSLRRVTFVRPAVSVLDRGSGDGFIVDYFSTRGWFGQRAVHSCRTRNSFKHKYANILQLKAHHQGAGGKVLGQKRFLFFKIYPCTWSSLACVLPEVTAGLKRPFVQSL